MKKYTSILSKHQITNGGNLILFQIENEIGGQRTSSGAENWPIIAYMKRLEQTGRESGLVIVSFSWLGSSGEECMPINRSIFGVVV
jgi:beta-galactosidase GanA